VDRTEKVTYLDTHAIVWLYEGTVNKLSRTALDRIQSDALFVSPAVILEIQFLHEIGRVTRTGPSIVAALSDDIGLEICQLKFQSVVDSALQQTWVRDPFDRLIVAHAAANDAPLITRDEKIRRHYKRAIW
jgi:PIN domain nuclease of toxin-antitoxin system